MRGRCSIFRFFINCRHASRFSARCAYCLSPEQMMGVAFEIDHIIPSSAGGRAKFDNLCLSCPTCNRHKAKRLSARDPLSRRIVTLFHPRRDIWSDHFAWSADRARILGLTPKVRHGGSPAF